MKKRQVQHSRVSVRIILISCIVLITLCSIFFANFLAQHNADVRQQAYVETEMVTKTKVRVMFVSLDPIENGKSTIEQLMTNVRGNRAAFDQENAAKWAAMLNQVIAKNYSIEVAKYLHIQTFPKLKDGTQYDFASFSKCISGTFEEKQQCEKKKWQVDYIRFVKDNQLCQIAKENDIDFFWVLSAPYMLTYEAFMVGPTSGYWVNGPGFEIDGCDKHYVVINPTYDRPEEFLHSYGHAIESSLLRFSSGFNTSNKKYFQYGIEKSLCGNIHYPPNARFEYDYTNSSDKKSYCGDWKNLPMFQNLTKNQGCSLWGCNNIGWYMYWMSSIPSENDILLFENLPYFTERFTQVSTNWWQYILNPDLLIQCTGTHECLKTGQGICAKSALRWLQGQPLNNPSCGVGVYTLQKKIGSDSLGYINWEQTVSAIENSTYTSAVIAFRPDIIPQDVKLNATRFCGDESVELSYPQLPLKTRCIGNLELGVKIEVKKDGVKINGIKLPANTESDWQYIRAWLLGQKKNTVYTLKRTYPSQENL